VLVLFNSVADQQIGLPKITARIFTRIEIDCKKFLHARVILITRKDALHPRSPARAPM
jgi:hypothetical protein